MDRVIQNLATIVQREVEDYANGDWWAASAFAVSDTKRQIYTVIVVPAAKKIKAGLVVMARILSDMVIIDHDTTDKPLWKELVAAGIPREQIILAYAGETVPINASSS